MIHAVCGKPNVLILFTAHPWHHQVNQSGTKAQIRRPGPCHSGWIKWRNAQKKTSDQGFVVRGQRDNRVRFVQFRHLCQIHTFYRIFWSLIGAFLGIINAVICQVLVIFISIFLFYCKSQQVGNHVENILCCTPEKPVPSQASEWCLKCKTTTTYYSVCIQLVYIQGRAAIVASYADHPTRMYRRVKIEGTT